MDDDLTEQALDQVATLQATIASLEMYTNEEAVLPSVATLEQKELDSAANQEKEIGELKKQIKKFRDQGDIPTAKQLAGTLSTFRTAFEQQKEPLRKAKEALRARMTSCPAASDLARTPVDSVRTQEHGMDGINVWLRERRARQSKHFNIF